MEMTPLNWVQTDYEAVRDSMRIGDMIAFSGKSAFSNIIKTITRSGVSHVAAVLDTNVEGTDRIQVIESTSLDGFIGVSTSFLSDRLRDYHGEAWWFPLGNPARTKMDTVKYYDWMMLQNKKPYDFPQAVQSGLDSLWDWGGLMYAKEDFDKLFCSELLAGAQEVSKIIKRINASEVTPRDQTRFDLWYPYYYQILGEKRELQGCGTVDPEGFGI